VARELAKRGITCNAVAPGFIKTDMTDVLPDKAKEMALAAIPMQRMGLPEEVAAVIAFFASDDAGYVTGHVLAVDGGMAP
jgi:3-oxoacyl-[acyl-carrier protein] reductase